ncbi:colanic acid biosynthesis glycosyl transferase WcaI [Arenibacter palladensis]|uniref:Colanic acid biosynthesis glycosyl transferase WcaI n=1 Tax=Arenibacter palladensis TaxID=237373 RepID=A0A1M5HN23_9FLAO|nr:WcaI family glycosyltransferase [Arenibacter palladensis]SHG17350.1 colanic acid biosynthesis glycosyl transferase WcaI [Arenibacter palladensis]
MKETKAKRILFIGYNFSPELTGIGKYSGEMMHWLAEKGHHCTVVTAYPYYPYWKVQKPYRKNRFWYKKEVTRFDSGGQLQVLRCPMYVPKEPTGIRRMILDTSFSGTAFVAILAQLFQKKYDWVISVAPSFQFGLLGVLYKKLRGAKHLHHIQDLQIEAAQDLGLIKSKKLLQMLYGTERFIFKHTDIVSSISDGMMDRIGRKANKPILFFPNWTDTTSFFPIPDSISLKGKFGFKSTDWVVLYSGAIGEKQGLEAILHAAKALESYPQIQFVICGTGPYKMNLREMTLGMHLENVQFFPLQPKKDFNAFLNMADLHLVIQKEKASDLVMPSKLTTIMAVGGLALITANPESTLHKVVSKYEMGLLVAAENQQVLIVAILEAYLNKDNKSVKKAARVYAEQYLAINKIMEAFNCELHR